jgi:hypothetical protein
MAETLAADLAVHHVLSAVAEPDHPSEEGTKWI